MADKGKLFVISAPSGAGKTTLERMLLDSELDLVKSVSVTTRKPRPDEIEGKHYYFLSEEEFLKRKDAGNFLEWAEVFGNYYATPKDKIEELLDKGKNIILSIDVQGAEQIKEKHPEAVLIFIKTADFEELKRRLEKRLTEKPREIDARLKEAKEELARSKMYDYVVVNSEDKIQEAFEDLKNIIKANTAR